jgi:predicted DNA-binding ribbon-helix-helix protein
MAIQKRPVGGQDLPWPLRSGVIKRSIAVGGHKTSISLEDAFWDRLKEIARSRDMTVSEIVGYIDSRRNHANLSSTIRLFVLEYALAQRKASAADAAAQPAGNEGSFP